MKLINNEDYSFIVNDFESRPTTINMTGRDIVQILTCHRNVMVNNMVRFIVMKGGAFIDENTLNKVLQLEKGKQPFEITSEEEELIIAYVNSNWMQMPRYTTYPVFIENTMQKLKFIKRMLYDSEKDCFQITFKLIR